MPIILRRVKNHHRRLPSLTLLLCLLCGAAAANPQPGIRSQAALVLDGTTGTVLYSRNMGDAAPIASITKLMTALVVLDGQQSLDEDIQITAAERTATRGVASRLAVGAHLSRRDLLLLALMSSENRAAQALARSYPGGTPAFVRSMNDKARALGMTRTSFSDPTGLSNHNVASPSDLARLVMAADRSALIREYSTTASYTVRVGRQMVEFRNTNPLVRDPAWDVSVQKTGHIADAGECLVLQARIDGRPIVMVLLNSVGKYTRVADARRIRKWMAASAPVMAGISPAS